MQKTPLISIVVPCYNHGQYLKELIGSINASNISIDYELLIINDGSNDPTTISTLIDLENNGYMVIHQQNFGLASARNKLINIANSEFILPLDSDNRLSPGFIEAALKILTSNEDYDIVYSDVKCFGGKTGIWEVGPFNLQRLMLSNYIDACAIFRKKMWADLGGYDEKMPSMGLEDWDFWLRASFKGYQFFYLRMIGFEYRFSQNSMIHSLDFKKHTEINIYMSSKHNQILGSQFISCLVEKKFHKNRGLLIKLFLTLFFPTILNLLLKYKIIKTREIFNF